MIASVLYALSLGMLAAGSLVMTAHAAPGPLPVVVFFSARSAQDSADMTEKFISGLKETGYVDGKNVAVEYRWGNGDYQRLPSLARELAKGKVAVIVAISPPAALAAKAATPDIPIVFNVGIDPVSAGLVTTLNRPGGNVTGVTLFTTALVAKRLELLHEVMPKARVIGALANPKSPNTAGEMKVVQEAAKKLGKQLLPAYAADEAQLQTAFKTLIEKHADALVVFADPFFNSKADVVAKLAARHSLPGVYGFRDYVVQGGLLSYGADLSQAVRQTGVYAGRILRGEKPGNMPVLQPTTFALVINAKTAKSLGIRLPQSLLARADEVIQ